MSAKEQDYLAKNTRKPKLNTSSAYKATGERSPSRRNSVGSISSISASTPKKIKAKSSNNPNSPNPTKVKGISGKSTPKHKPSEKSADANPLSVTKKTKGSIKNFFEVKPSNQKVTKVSSSPSPNDFTFKQPKSLAANNTEVQQAVKATSEDVFVQQLSPIDTVTKSVNISANSFYSAKEVNSCHNNSLVRLTRWPQKAPTLRSTLNQL